MGMAVREPVSRAGERRRGFACGRGGAGGFLGVEAIGIELCLGRHNLVSANSYHGCDGLGGGWEWMLLKE